jgi:hypothetical protein
MGEHFSDNIQAIPPRLELTKKKSQSSIVYQYLLSYMKLSSDKLIVVICLRPRLVRGLGPWIGLANTFVW